MITNSHSFSSADRVLALCQKPPFFAGEMGLGALGSDALSPPSHLRGAMNER